MPAPLSLTPPFASMEASSGIPDPKGNMPPTRHRFTRDGDPELERHLAHVCDLIGAGCRGLLAPTKLQGVVLGGGYGRGEGGVWHTGNGDRPYNDLEFYVFLRGSRHVNERIHRRVLHVLAQIMTPQAGIDVEFRIASLPELEASTATMFSYDLVCGHRWVIGDDSLFAACAHHLDAESIPASEATRLMMNRCTGLLLARERLERAEFTTADADFVARNIAKAQLAAGDALLATVLRYHWSVIERHRRLEEIAAINTANWPADVFRHHTAGVDFKLHPSRSAASRDDLAARHAETGRMCREVWLWLENRRLGTHFNSVDEYAESREDKWLEGSPGRRALVNANVFGFGTLMSKTSLQHPRTRVLSALPLLLWQPDALSSPVLLARLQHELRTDTRDWNGMVAAYRSIWERVN